MSIIFLGLPLQEEHFFVFIIFSTMNCLGESHSHLSVLDILCLIFGIEETNFLGVAFQRRIFFFYLLFFFLLCDIGRSALCCCTSFGHPCALFPNCKIKTLRGVVSPRGTFFACIIFIRIAIVEDLDNLEPYFLNRQKSITFPGLLLQE
jgi:hypothetical protein